MTHALAAAVHEAGTKIEGRRPPQLVLTRVPPSWLAASPRGAELLDWSLLLTGPDADSRAEARIRIGGVEDSVVIPRTALRGESDAHWVLVATVGGSTRRQTVQTGAGDRVRVSILEGLDGGERLLIGGDDPAETAEGV